MGSREVGEGEQGRGQVEKGAAGGLLVEAWPSPLQRPGQHPDDPEVVPIVPVHPVSGHPSSYGLLDILVFGPQEGECSQYHAEHFGVAGREVFSGLPLKKGQLDLVMDRPVAPT